MARALWRRAAGSYLALFLVAAAAAPHHHVNGLEDLLLDQPSDSGEIVESSVCAGESAGGAGSALDSFWIIDDVPCLACFCSDFVSAPPPVVGFTPTLERVAFRPAPVPRRALPPIERDAPSRAPPRAA